MTPRKTNGRRNVNQPAPPSILEDPLNEHVSHPEFRVAFTTLANLVVSQNEHPTSILANPVANTTTARIWDFTQMNPPQFPGFNLEEDPQEFLDQVQKVTDIMGVTSSESAKIVAYQLQDIAHTWFKKLKVDRGIDVEPIEWKKFATAFLERFYPLELREAKVLEFINLRQGSMRVKEYFLKFTQLARNAPHVVTDSRSKMSKFISSVNYSVFKSCELLC